MVCFRQEQRAKALPIEDPRRNAYSESRSCKVALAPPSALPNSNTKFSSAGWKSAVQHKFGVYQPSCHAHHGSPIIRNHTNCKPVFVDMFGYKPKTVSGVKDDGIRHLHGKIVDVFSGWLRKAKMPHRAVSAAHLKQPQVSPLTRWH